MVADTDSPNQHVLENLRRQYGQDGVHRILQDNDGGAPKELVKNVLERRSIGSSSHAPPKLNEAVPAERASLERISTGYGSPAGRPNLARQSGEAITRAAEGREGLTHAIWSEHIEDTRHQTKPAPPKTLEELERLHGREGARRILEQDS